MKIREVSQNLNEGPLDAIKRGWEQAKGFAKGGTAGRQAVVQQQAGADILKRVADGVIAGWNRYLVNLPPNADPSKSLATFADSQFKDYVSQTNVPTPGSDPDVPGLSNLRDFKNAQNYIYRRAQEYIAQRTTPAQQKPASELGLGATNPRAPAGFSHPTTGYEYYYEPGSGWINVTDKIAVKDPKNIQSLNQWYYQFRQAHQQGKYPVNPDKPTRPAWLPPVPAPAPTPTTESRQLNEGGKAVKGAAPVARDDVAGVVNQAKKALPAELLKNLQADIGSAGYKVESGDIDIMVDADDVVSLYGTANLADPVKAAKIMLKKHFESQGIDATLDGRNVSIGVVYSTQATGEKRIGQVDVMVIKDVKLVAPWHQHGPRGMYDQPGFKASETFILLSSIAKHLNLKLDPFAAKLVRRDTGDVVGRTRKEVAKILLNPRAKESDLNSVQSIMQALETDPDREGKLTQARQDAEKGLLRLPESAPYNTAAYFRKISDVVR